MVLLARHYTPPHRLAQKKHLPTQPPEIDLPTGDASIMGKPDPARFELGGGAASRIPVFGENLVEYDNVNWIVAIVSLLAGLGIGAIGYHLLNSSTQQTQALRRQVTERERELDTLRTGLNEHFSQVGMMVNNIQREMRTLEHRLTEDASTLECDASIGGQTAGHQLAAAGQPALAGTEADIPTPRDYADGTGGTLSEDFGLKPATGQESLTQPPRY